MYEDRQTDKHVQDEFTETHTHTYIPYKQTNTNENDYFTVDFKMPTMSFIEWYMMFFTCMERERERERGREGGREEGREGGRV